MGTCVNKSTQRVDVNVPTTKLLNTLNYSTVGAGFKKDPAKIERLTFDKK